MIIINPEDLISSIADSLQAISYAHPRDFIQAMARAYEKELNPAAKDAMAQILINSRMAAIGQRPICQDTGIVTVFLKVGMQCRFDTDLSIQELGMQEYAGPGSIRQIPCAPQCSPTPLVLVKIPGTTLRP